MTKKYELCKTQNQVSISYVISFERSYDANQNPGQKKLIKIVTF